MWGKFFAVIVALFAVFFGGIFYNAYQNISPKLESDQKVVPFLFNVNNEICKIIGDKLGLVPKYKMYRWFFSTMSEPIFLAKPEAEGITIKDSVISGVPVKIFQPDQAEGDIEGRPGLIYFHGGGLSMGSANWHFYIQHCIMFAQGERELLFCSATMIVRLAN
jgi:acetyl esterase/lipase